MQTRAKLTSSLAWLSKFVDLDATRTMLLTPYTRHELRGEAIAFLVIPTAYVSVYHHIYPSEPLDHTSFWPLIHGLARRGIYVLEGDETAVNDSMLKQRNPFRELAHLALLDGLMAAYVSSVVTVERVVKAVRRYINWLFLRNVSSFNPSKELPASLEGALLLWVQKVTQAVNEARRSALAEPVEDGPPRVAGGSAPRQRRHNRMSRAAKLEGVTVLEVTDIAGGLADGQCLAALLLYYVPQEVGWKDFYFSTEPLSSEQCLHNHNRIKQFCNARLTPLAFHILPCDLVNFAPTGILKSNTDAMLAHLFWCLETQGLTKMALHQDSSVFSEVPSVRNDRHVFGTRKGIKPIDVALSTVSQQGRGSLVQPTVNNRAPLPLSSSSSSSLLIDPNQRVGATDSNIPSSVMLKSSLSAPQLDASVVYNESGGKLSIQHKSLISASVETLRVTERLPSTSNLQCPGQNAVRVVDSSVQHGNTDQEERAAYLNFTFESGPLHDAPINTPRSQHFLKQTSEREDTTQQAGHPASSSPGEPNPSAQTTYQSRPNPPPLEHATPKDSQSYLHLSQLNEGSNASLSVVHSEIPRSTKVPPNADTISALACKSDSIAINARLHHISTDMRPEQNPSMGQSSLQSKHTPESANHHSGGGSFTISKQHSYQPVVSSASSQDVHAESETTTVAFKQTPPSSECHRIQLLPSRCRPPPPEDPSRVPREVLKVREKLMKLKDDFLKSEALHQQQWCRQRRELYFNLVRATVQKPSRQSAQSGEALEDGDRVWEDGDDRQGHEEVVKLKSPETVTNTVGEDGLGILAQDPTSAGEGKINLQHKMVEGSGGNTEGLIQRKVQQLKVKLEEREKVRRAVAKERKRRHSIRRGVQECEQVNYNVQENSSELQSSSEVDVCKTGSDVLQYRLTCMSSEESHALRSRSHPEFITHDGPQCYVQPQLKSNKKLIKNALCHACLAGEVNVSIKQRALTELDSHQASHFLILFRDTLGFKFRALYYLVPDEDYIMKVFGNGPHKVTSSQVSNLYKYNSGAKQFKEVPSKSFSLSVDALTIKNEYWLCRKTRPPL